MAWFLSLIIAAAMSAPTVVPAPGSRTSYRYVFAGHFWNGAPAAADRTDTLENDFDTITLSKHDNVSHQTTTTPGKPNADGTVSFAGSNAPSDPFAPYNAVALLVHGAQSYDTGAQWKSSIAVQTGQTASDVTSVPIAVTVVKLDGNVLTVQGTGTVSAVSTYGDYRDPVDLTITLAARFVAGTLQRADYRASEYVHAGPLSQTMTWTWSLALETDDSGGAQP
jgi:hypothetical protein